MYNIFYNIKNAMKLTFCIIVVYIFRMYSKYFHFVELLFRIKQFPDKKLYEPNHYVFRFVVKIYWTSFNAI